MKLDSALINEYLYYGYAGDLSWFSSSGLLPIKKNGGRSASEVAKYFDLAVDRIFLKAGEFDTCVIPLSGGYDSRILLGAALERLGSNRIKVVTFGQPGQLDYDIGIHIAKELGIKSVSVDLSKVMLDWDALCISTQESPWTYVPDGFYNRHALESAKLSPKDIVLSGFMGDPLTGGHAFKRESDSVLSDFIMSQQREKNMWLPDACYRPDNKFTDLLASDYTVNADFLDFGVRQSSCISSIVSPLKKWKNWDSSLGALEDGVRFYTPFVDPEWASYWLHMDKKAKKGQSLYLEFLHLKFPYLAQFPSKATWGVRPNRKIMQKIFRYNCAIRYRLDKALKNSNVRCKCTDNYVNFDEAFRSRADFKKIALIAIEYLEVNKVTPWLNLRLIYRDHCARKYNYSNALLVLIGLALNLHNESQKKD
jgi:hypothetical protein